MTAPDLTRRIDYISSRAATRQAMSLGLWWVAAYNAMRLECDELAQTDLERAAVNQMVEAIRAAHRVHPVIPPDWPPTLIDGVRFWLEQGDPPPASAPCAIHQRAACPACFPSLAPVPADDDSVDGVEWWKR